jgi:CheY-like chemotaxis protein
MRSLRVLVVDDDQIICTLLDSILTKQGHQVTTHTAPRAGLSAAGGQQFDLVMLDIRMPDLDGIEALKAMRPLLPKAEFVMITASAADERVSDALSAGASLCLAKPFDPDMVEQLLETLFLD